MGRLSFSSMEVEKLSVEFLRDSDEMQITDPIHVITHVVNSTRLHIASFTRECSEIQIIICLTVLILLINGCLSLFAYIHIHIPVRQLTQHQTEKDQPTKPPETKVQTKVPTPTTNPPQSGTVRTHLKRQDEVDQTTTPRSERKYPQKSFMRLTEEARAEIKQKSEILRMSRQTLNECQKKTLKTWTSTDSHVSTKSQLSDRGYHTSSDYIDSFDEMTSYERSHVMAKSSSVDIPEDSVGMLKLKLIMNPSKALLTVKLLSCENIDLLNQDVEVYLRVSIHPSSHLVYKTRIRYGLNPIFNETAEFLLLDRSKLCSSNADRSFTPYRHISIVLYERFPLISTPNKTTKFILPYTKNTYQTRAIGDCLLLISEISSIIEEEIDAPLIRRLTEVEDTYSEKSTVSTLSIPVSTHSQRMIQIGISYLRSSGALQIEILNTHRVCTGQPNMEVSVKICLFHRNELLFPAYHTRSVKGVASPAFDESVRHLVSPFIIDETLVEVILLKKKRLRRKKMCGSVIFSLISGNTEASDHWCKVIKDGGRLIRWHSPPLIES